MGNGEAETQAKASLRHMKNLVKSRETRATSRTRMMDFRSSPLEKEETRWVAIEIGDTWPDASIQTGPVMPFHLIGLGLADEEVSYIRGCKHHEIPCPFEEY
jgi:hypothetical protein